MLWMMLAGCDSGPGLVGSFLGELVGTDAKIGVALEEQQITVFVAGGEDTLATHTRFFVGERAEDDTFEATTDGWEVSGHVEGGGVFGDLVAPDGILTPWNVNPPIDPGRLDGIWVAPEGEGACQAAVLLYNSEFNLQGGYCPAEGEIVSVSAVDLDTADGVIDLNANAPAGMIVFTATPVLPRDE
jgi:hypothetical protein